MCIDILFSVEKFSMSSAKPTLNPIKSATLPSKTTPEQRYWRAFGSPQLIKENHPITGIDFNPVTFDFAVSSSTKVQVFSGKTRQVVKTFSRFKDLVFGVNYRYDGKVFVATDKTGLVSIYDSYQPRNLLVSIVPSTYETHTAKFHPAISSQLATGSDDKTLRLYDISQTQNALWTSDSHNDYIRTCDFIPNNPNLLLSGSYDGVVRLFDTRIASVVNEFDHGSPIEDVLGFSLSTIISAGGPQVKIWDLNMGTKINELNNFAKTAMKLHNTHDKGLLVGSLDGHVKIFDSTNNTWTVKFGWKFGSGGILACAVSPMEHDHKHFVTGLALGLLSIRTRKTEPKVKQGIKQIKTNAYSRMLRGMDYNGDEEYRSINPSQPNTQQLKVTKNFVKLLNSFKWSEALDNGVQSGVSKEQTISILSELKKRGKIRSSLDNRDEISLIPILSWLNKNIEDVRSFTLVADYLTTIFELYNDVILNNSDLLELFNGIYKKLEGEIKKAKDAYELKGILELLAI